MRILPVFAIFTMMSISAVLPARKQENKPLSSDAFTMFTGRKPKFLSLGGMPALVNEIKRLSKRFDIVSRI
ncbi:hypothetical protein C6499_16595 [Candidatus Poribacteria bacterium]|nr:MAG: hypothetical protein C6499_16595 [Candidatus Poribacteria bacterium]